MITTRTPDTTMAPMNPTPNRAASNRQAGQTHQTSRSSLTPSDVRSVS